MKKVRYHIKHAVSLSKFDQLYPMSTNNQYYEKLQSKCQYQDQTSPISTSSLRQKFFSYGIRTNSKLQNPEKNRSYLKLTDNKQPVSNKNYYNKSIECIRKPNMHSKQKKNKLSILYDDKNAQKKLPQNIFKKKSFNNISEGKLKIKTKISQTLIQTSQTYETYQNILQRKKIPSFIQQKIKNTNGFCKNDFESIKSLGKGKFCEVQLVRHKVTNFIMAMKIFDFQRIIAMNFLEQFTRQLKIQSFLDHPNIIQIYGYFQQNEKFYVLMELGSHGELFSYLKQIKKCFSEEGTSFVTNQLLQACSYLHSKRIIHRDIKPENIVMVHGTIKLCDFGWAAYNEKSVRSTYCGTPLYFSPELMKGQQYDEKVDVWAIGILTYELMFNTTPFQITSRKDLSKIIYDNQIIPADTDPNFVEFIKSMLNKDPNKRISCENLLNYSFIKQYEGLETCQQLLY